MRKYVVLILALFIALILTACGNGKGKNPYYYDTFDQGKNIEMRWGGIKTVVPSTWHAPKEEAVNIADVFANMCSTNIFRLNKEYLGNTSDLNLQSQETINIINDFLSDYNTDVGYSNFKFIGSQLYAKGTHKVITTKEICVLKHKAKWYKLDADFTSYCFVLKDNLYIWSIVKLSNEDYSAIKDLEKVINAIEFDSQWVNSNSNGLHSIAQKEFKQSTATLAEIDVWFKRDKTEGEKLVLKVFTKNNSSEVFSGNVYVCFYSDDGKKRLGSDTIIVEKLPPGREGWARVVVAEYKGMPKLKVDFSEVRFEVIDDVVANIDLEATKKIKDSYTLNFDGVGWYNDVVDIIVYVDGNCIVTIKDNSKNDGQFYASTVKACGKENNIKCVKVVNQQGKILTVY